MANKKNTLRALLLSAISVLACVAMLVGTTFAWFTDSVSSMNNIIKSGNLDMVVEYKTDWADDWAELTEATKLFSEENLYEPGYTEVVFLRVANAGSLALKYSLAANIISETTSTNVYGEEFALSDYLQIGSYVMDEMSSGANYADILFPFMFGTREAARQNATSTVDLSAGVAVNDSPLLPGDDTAQVVALVVYMPEEVGNEANHKTGVAAPEIKFGLNVLATQYTHEEDSFDNQYDKNAGYDYGKTNVGPYKLNVLAGGVSTYDGDTKTYTNVVETLAQGGWNQSQGNYYAGYTVNVGDYGDGATVKFTKANGTEVTWSLADEERDGFITNGIHQQWTSVGLCTAYHYDIDGDGVTDFTVVNDASATKVESATVEQLKKVIEQEGVSAILTADIALTEKLAIAADADVTIDLNGKTLSAINSTAAASCAIENKGALTIENGTLTYEGVGDPNFGYGTNTINNSGKLVIDGATVINTTNSGSSNAIDNAPGAELTVNSGVIKSEKVTIRLRDGSSATINGGEISGARAVQIHLFQNVDADTKLTINGGIFNGDYALYSYAYGNCTFAKTTVTITDGIFNGIVAFGGGNKTVTETVNITGGTFNDYLGRYLANDGWVDIAKP